MKIRSPDDIKKRKRCPECGNWQKYKTIKLTLAAKTKNTICHRCANKKIQTPEHREKLSKSSKKGWTPERRKEQSKRFKKIYESYSLEELVEIRSRQVESRKRNFAKRKKENPEWYESWIRKLKKSFKKYRGENHWMKRQDVYRKVKDSCAIYKNGGHWFHTNPESLQKMLRTKKLKEK